VVNFERFDLPEIGSPREIPALGPEVFQSRFQRLEVAREAAGFDCLAIYADREHSANLAWLCGFDPRFEEALWLQVGGAKPTLLVGNENLDYAPLQLELEAELALYQPFSLPNQDRGGSTSLRALLKRFGFGRGMRCGLLGWKPMPAPEAPYWIVQALRDVVGEEPVNANHLLMDVDTGLRLVLEPEMVRSAEYAAALTSEAVRAWVFGLREGITEREAAKSLVSYGMELSCHPMVNFGRPIASGLGSAGNRRALRGEYGQTAFGVRGGLTCRAGRLVTSQEGDDPDHYRELVENYLEVVRSWYARLSVGTRAGDVVSAAHAIKSDLWDFALNPGHLISLDEWVASPFFGDSEVLLKSGHAIQQDIIPVPRAGSAFLNMEDGLLLADEELRELLTRLDPDMMRRCQSRRELMEELGYELLPDILPLSNIAGVFFPYLLEPRYVARFI
jgi:Xaa-Pro aminopeptidase